MLNKNGWRKTLSKPLAFLIAVVFILNLVGCGTSEPSEPNLPSRVTPEAPKPVAEVSPPKLIQTLHPSLDTYQPQVTIVSPQANEVIEDNTINVQLEVRDLPLFKNPDWGLGPHLQLILDHKLTQSVYEIDQPITLSDLTAGTHTLRVFAVYPWGESFKNDGAYTQTTFDVFTATPNNNPLPELPLLTYNSPQGNYGAEPILLDFYLANAPLHLVAAEDPEDEIIDWRIRVTLNGESFMIDQWEPIYIKGVKPGKNWVKLEYLDQNGEPLNNVYNNTAGVFTYQPNGQDSLSKLVRGEIAIAQALAIVDPSYTPGAIIPISEPEEIPAEITSTEAEEVLEDIPAEVTSIEAEEVVEEVTPTQPEEVLEEVTSTEAEEVLEEITPTEAEDIPAAVEEVPSEEEVEAIPEAEVEPLPVKAVEPIEPEEVQQPEIEAQPSVEPETQAQTAKTGGIFNNISNRWKQLPFFNQETSQPPIPSAEPEVVEPTEAEIEPIEPEGVQQPEIEAQPSVEPETQAQTAKTGGIFNNISNRWKQLPFLNKGTSQTPTPSAEPEVVEPTEAEIEPIDTPTTSTEEPQLQPTLSSDEAETVGIFNNISNRLKQLPFFNQGTSQPTIPSAEPEVVEPTEAEIEPIDTPAASTEEPQLQPTLSSDEAETVGIFNNISNRLKQLPFFNKEATEPTPAQTLPEIVEEAPIPETVEETQPQQSPELIPDELELTSDIPTEQPTPLSEPIVEEVTEPTAEETVEAEPIVEEVTEPTTDETVETETAVEEPETQPEAEPLSVLEIVEESSPTQPQTQVPEAQKTPVENSQI